MSKRIREWWVYVVELEPEASRRVSAKGVVYVGETSLLSELRFAKHMSGHKAARKVHQYGRHLRPDLAPKSAFLSRENSLKAERRTATRLRNQGYIVFGGQGIPFMVDSATLLASKLTRG
ncbi:hypothetical protein [Aeromicrobium sp. A1-2]|uniref:hypothetical protein n=1 Tax=Aeromicrobium sp. A1-2 TaxID=2107713 RepID=UPI0013C31C74|nr:hypothetical protein [Aeromicrobium sp. A1-2]